MQVSLSKRALNSRWYWLTVGPSCVGIRGAGLWTGAFWGTGNKAAPVQPMAGSTHWAAEPTSSAMAPNLLKTPMTNPPEIAP